MEYNDEQKRIITATENKVVVIAAAASGKTRSLIGRIQYLIDNGNDANSIVAITYTNAAAIEMRRRLKNCENVFIGTIHSYCNQILVKYGINTNDILDKEEFDELFELIDKNPEICPNVEHLIVDEFQDCSSLHYHFLFDILKPKNWMVFGDPRQSIYSFLGGNPSLMLNLAQEEGVKIYQMRKNYRNGIKILNFARSYSKKRGMDYVDDSIPMREIEGNITFIKNKTLFDALSSIDFNIPKDWFILARTNIQVEMIKSILDKLKVPNIILRRKDLDNEGLLKIIDSDTVIISTVHQAKGLERNNVIIFGLRENSEEEVNICYVAITRAKNKLYWIKNIRKNKYTF